MTSDYVSAAELVDANGQIILAKKTTSILTTSGSPGAEGQGTSTIQELSLLHLSGLPAHENYRRMPFGNQPGQRGTNDVVVAGLMLDPENLEDPCSTG
jgi:hypothetical protein